MAEMNGNNKLKQWGIPIGTVLGIAFLAGGAQVQIANHSDSIKSLQGWMIEHAKHDDQVQAKIADDLTEIKVTLAKMAAAQEAAQTKKGR